MCRYDLEAALKFYEKALTISPEDTDLLDGAGELCLECGRSEDALKLFTKSIQLKPEESAAKYMNVGQLLAGEDSVRHYAKGMQLLQTDLARAGEDAEAATKIRQRLCTGYVSMTELYMTVRLRTITAHTHKQFTHTHTHTHSLSLSLICNQVCQAAFGSM